MAIRTNFQAAEIHCIVAGSPKQLFFEFTNAASNFEVHSSGMIPYPPSQSIGNENTPKQAF